MPAEASSLVLLGLLALLDGESRRTLGELPARQVDELRDARELREVDLVDGVRGLVVIAMEAREEERDRDALLGEVVVVAPVIDAFLVVLEVEPDVLLVDVLDDVVEDRRDLPRPDQVERVDVLI